MAGIAIRGLSKSFGARDASFAAVADLDLEIKDNSFVTLLGPSGCGKTTTLRLIAGYIVPDKGTIEVDGRVLSSPGAVVSPEARGMGMVFQNYAVWPHKTVFENVVFGLKLRRIPTAAAKKQVETALALVNLSGLEGRYPNELSGGQQQRVALARSLVVEPSILLLDEPLSNLDAKLRERMRTELKELQRRTGITFVYVTHDQAETLALSDHVAVMSGGRLQQYGTPFEVYAHPANRMVADFMGLVNLVPGKVRALANGGGTVEISPDLTLDVAALDGLKPGESVDVAIRPENIRLTALASEASGQRGDSQVRAPDTRPEPGSTARAALASEASGQRGDSQVRAHSASEDARERADDTRPEPGSTARAAPAGAGAKLAKITNHVFLGNINEYYATLPSGQVLRVQTHPLQHFKIGEEVAVEVDATQCSVFRGATGHTT